MVTEKRLNKMESQVEELLSDLRLTVVDSNIRLLTQYLYAARQSEDLDTTYKVVERLRNYLSSIYSSSVTLHFYGQNRKIEVLQDMRYGKVVSVRKYDLQRD